MSSYGKAKWASDLDLEDAGLFSDKGQFLGLSHSKRKIIYEGENHLFTLAPPGTGKSTSVVVPSLLTNPGNVVVTDPKAVVTIQTARARREMGHKVVVLNPWKDEIAAATGQEMTDTGFNPLHILKRGDPALFDNAEMIAEMLCPTPHDAKDPYWTETGAAILAGCLVYLTYADEAPTLPRLYQLVRDNEEGWRALTKDMLALEHLVDLSAQAAEILEPLESPKQWGGIAGKMKAATRPYNPNKPLADHVSRHEFDPATLKTDSVSVYIVIPSKRRDANRGWLALVNAMLFEAIGAPGKSRRVTFICEEFANLGYMPSIFRAMAEYREAGLQVHIVVQTLEALYRLYGRDGAQEIMNLCAVRQFFGIDSLNTAQELERTCGTYTAINRSTSYRLSNNQPGENGALGILSNAQNISESNASTPLIRASEIMTLPLSEQIILTRGETPPIRAYLYGFFHDEDMLAALDSNPMREGDQSQVVPFDKPNVNDEKLLHWVSVAWLALLGGLIWIIGSKDGRDNQRM